MPPITFLLKGLALAALLAVHAAPPALAGAGKYERRRSARGEWTDTSAKVSTYGFIDDRQAPPHRLALFADVGAARTRREPGLLPVLVGLAHRGESEAVRLHPSRFALSWEGADEPVRALTNRELLRRPGGLRALRQLARVARLRTIGLPFDGDDGLRVGTRFHADPTATTLLNDDVRLPPGAWFVDSLFFPVPVDLDIWEPAFRLQFLGVGDEPLVTLSFRIEPDPQLHRRAFRRARRARAKEDRIARRKAAAARRGDTSPDDDEPTGEAARPPR